MKTLLAFSLTFVLAGPARAASMDPLVVGGDMYKKVFENAAVRVMEVTFPPGGKIGMHSHPDHFVYALTGGSIRITDDAGKAADVTLTPGQVLWLDAQSHKGENTGPSEVKLVVTELKGRRTKTKIAPK